MQIVDAEGARMSSDRMSRPLLKPDEAAALLNISGKQLGFLIHAGEIRYVNVGLGEKRERRRFDPIDIDDFIERRKAFGGSNLASAKGNSRSRYYQLYDIKEIRDSLRNKKPEGRK